MTDRGSPSVGVVAVNYNGAAFIAEFVASLRAVTYPRYELVVVDNASTDGSRQWLERCRDVTLIPLPENTGITGGNNAGARYCLERGHAFVLFINSDTTVEPDFLDRLVAAADDRTLVVPKILYYYDRSLVNTHAGGFDWWRGVFRDTFHGKPDGPAANVDRSIQTASFCCMLLPARVFHDVGFIDERFFMYYDDTDYVARALAAGYRLRYHPAAVIYHRESASSGGGWMTPFKHYYATRNRLYLVKKHVPRWRYALFTAYFLATRVPIYLRHLVKRDARMRRALTRAVLDYYRGRLGRTLDVADL
ncbi:MAG TPA: glycosyltransferase family 2 protein [Dehalococcoidia bacterium]